MFDDFCYFVVILIYCMRVYNLSNYLVYSLTLMFSTQYNAIYKHFKFSNCISFGLIICYNFEYSKLGFKCVVQGLL